MARYHGYVIVMVRVESVNVAPFQDFPKISKESLTTSFYPIRVRRPPFFANIVPPGLSRLP